MKAKQLAEELLKYPEYKVAFGFEGEKCSFKLEIVGVEIYCINNTAQVIRLGPTDEEL